MRFKKIIIIYYTIITEIELTVITNKNLFSYKNKV